MDRGSSLRLHYLIWSILFPRGAVRFNIMSSTFIVFSRTKSVAKALEPVPFGLLGRSSEVHRNSLARVCRRTLRRGIRSCNNMEYVYQKKMSTICRVSFDHRLEFGSVASECEAAAERCTRSTGLLTNTCFSKNGVITRLLFPRTGYQ